MIPGAVTLPISASSSSESCGLSSAARTSIAGFDARRARVDEGENECHQDAGDRADEQGHQEAHGRHRELEARCFPQRDEVADAEQRKNRQGDDRADGGRGDVCQHSRPEQEEQERAAREHERWELSA